MIRVLMESFGDRLRHRLEEAAARRAASRRRLQPVMAGYQHLRDDGRRWRRRLRYGLTFFVIVFYAFFLLLLPRQVMLPFLIPMLLLFGCVIWAMPVSDKPPPLLLDRLFWLYFGTIFLWPNYLALYISGLPWITFARLLCVPMVLMLLWCASTSQPFKDQMARARAAMPWMIGLIAAFSVLQVISIGFSDAAFITINRVFNNLITWTAIFFIAIWVFRDPGKLHKWIIAYVAMTAALCAMALAEAWYGGVLWAGRVPSFLKPPDPIVDEILAGSYRLTGQYRVQATQTTPLSLAEMISMAVPLMFHVATRYPKTWVLLALLALDIAIIYTLLLADSRLGFISLILGHLLALLFFGWAHWRTVRRSLIGPAITLMYPAMAIVTVLAITLIGRVRVRVLGSGQHQGSNEAREDQWRLGLEKIWESPLFGFGADRGGWHVGYYTPGGELTIDSYYLSILMDYGVIGFVLFYGMLLYAVVSGVKRLKPGRSRNPTMMAALTIFLFQFLVIKSVLSQAANHPLVFMALGGLVALAVADKQGESKLVRPR